MRDALLKGKLGISALSPRVTTGKEQWQEWHHDFFHNQMEDAIKADRATHAAADQMDTDLEVITLRESQQTALEVRRVVVSADVPLHRVRVTGSAGPCACCRMHKRAVLGALLKPRPPVCCLWTP